MQNLQIDKIIHGGRGLGRLDNGIIVLTPFVLPGEKVALKETKKKRGYIEAEVLEIIEPSRERVSPACQYYMQCGGCDFQHMRIEAQHTAKEGVIHESLQRERVSTEKVDFSSIIPSPENLHYRHRIRMKVSPGGEIGFHRAGSNSIINIEHCPVASDKLNKALAELRSSGLLQTIAKETKEIELLHSPADDLIFCLIHPSDNIAYPHVIDIEPLPELDFIDGISLLKGRKTKSVQSNKIQSLKQHFNGSASDHSYSLSWTPGCFSQVNVDQNANLVDRVCQLAEVTNGTEVLDLFCGMGNFSIPLALQNAVVTGIEHNAQCIEQAKRNAYINEVTNTKFIDQDVNKWIRKAVNLKQKYNIVLLDPPRQGMGKNITMLAAFSPDKIIYISCDPATLARDISQLQTHGYKLTNISPVDMFPQTHHIESIALLEKN